MQKLICIKIDIKIDKALVHATVILGYKQIMRLLSNYFMSMVYGGIHFRIFVAHGTLVRSSYVQIVTTDITTQM